MFILFFFQRHYRSPLPDFLCDKVAPVVKVCLQPILVALNLCEDSHGNPSQLPLNPFYVDG